MSSHTPCCVPLGPTRKLGEGLLGGQRGRGRRRIRQSRRRDIHLLAHLEHHFETFVLRAFVDVVPGFTRLPQRDDGPTWTLFRGRFLHKSSDKKKKAGIEYKIFVSNSGSRYIGHMKRVESAMYLPPAVLH